MIGYAGVSNEAYINNLTLWGTGVSGNTQANNYRAYADDAAAGAAGLKKGQVYQTNGTGAAPLNVPGILMIKQ